MPPSRKTPKKSSTSKAPKERRPPAEEDEDEASNEPVQTEEEKRWTRNSIRDINEKIIKLDQDSSMENSAELKDLMRDAKSIVPKVKGIQEAIEDAKMFTNLCAYIRKRSEDTSANEKKFIPSEFALKLALKLDGNVGSGDSCKFTKASLVSMGRQLSRYYCRTPALKFVLGALHTEAGEHKQERRRAARTRNKIAVATKTTVLDKNQPTGSETEKLVKKTLSCLEKECRERKISKMCYFTFVIDPDSFGNTVENMFHVSFLVKHHQAILSIGEQGLPVLEVARHARHQRDEEDEEEEAHRSEQAVMSISWSDWSELKENLNITRKCIVLDDLGRE